MKRYWRSENAAGDNGDVMANQLHLDGSHQLHPRALLFFGTQLKSKSVQRISSEEAYLRAGFRIGVNAAIAPGISTSGRYRRGGDDARTGTLSDLSLHEIGWEARYRRTRRLRADIGATHRWINYDRTAFVRGETGGLIGAATDQEDRTIELSAGLQYYREVLIRARYVFIDNHSNSAGYGYRAHRFNVLVTRRLARGFDGQLFFTTQVRRYDEELAEPVPVFPIDEVEYEQSVVAAKLYRQLTARYGFSLQYKHARNGSRADDDSYRKNVYAVGLDISF
jgi:hypothetical protein